MGSRGSERRAFLLAAVLGFAFGGADQYLGSRVTWGAWTSTASVMSAPWLALPFIAGATQLRPRRAIALGLCTVLSALAGYFALTLSPLESVPLSHVPSGLVHLARAQLPYIVGGIVTAPLFALLGLRWRERRSWPSALLLAAALCLEPVARWASGRLSPPDGVWFAEIALGGLAAAYFMLAAAVHRRSP